MTELSEISADYLAKAVRGKWASGSHDWILLKGDLRARVSGITKFTIGEEIAKVWIQDNEMAGDNKGESDRLINLSNFNDITDKAALLLSKFDGALPLGGLTELSDVAAEALSKHEGKDLTLWGLATLSDAAAESLSKHKGKRLELRGLTSISDSAADSLSKVQGSLFLGRLTSLSDAAADSLSKVQGDLYIGSLGGLPSLRSKPLAEKILRKSWPNAFKELRDMSDEVAEAFAQGDEGCFDGLISLSDAAADALSKVEAPLSLRGLVSLSDNAAKSLAKHKEERLYLSGLTSLTDVAAKYLSTHEGGALS